MLQVHQALQPTVTHRSIDTTPNLKAGQSLPNELLAKILSHVQKPLPSWLSVSRLFLESLEGTIYHRIVIHDNYTPSALDDHTSVSEHGTDPSMKSRLPHHTKSSILSDLPLRSTWRLDLLVNLEYLRLNVDYSVSNMPEHPLPSALRTLKHHTLVLRDVMSALALPKSIGAMVQLDALKKCVFVYTGLETEIESHPDDADDADDNSRPIRFPLLNVELVIIFGAELNYQRFRGLGLLDDGTDFEGDEAKICRSNNFVSWMMMISRIVAYGKSNITIVNSEALDESSPSIMDIRQPRRRLLEPEFRLAVDSWLGRDEERMKALRFISMKEYLSGEDWREVFEREEIQPLL